MTEGDQNPSTVTGTFQITVLPAADTIPPTVLSVNPQEGKTGVPRTTNVTITFSERMDAGSLNADTVKLVKAGSPPTPVEVTTQTSTDPSGRTVLTLDPITPKLAKAKTYRVTIEGAADTDGFAVRDLANNELAQDKVWSFKPRRR